MKTVKCSACDAPLPYGVSYCETCGEKVTREHMREAYDTSIFGKLQKAEDTYNTWTLHKITDHIVFKIVLLAIIAAYSIFMSWTQLSHVKLNSSDAYTIQYNEKADEYYIRTSEQEVNLSLFVPKRTKSISVQKIQDEDVVEEKTTTLEEYKNGESIALQNDTTVYFMLEAEYQNGKKDSIKLYVMP